MGEIVFRPIEKNEAGRAAEIERECLDTAWTEAQIASLPENAVYLGAFCGNTLCGTASMYCVVFEGQIMNIAVSASFRRRGIAEGLLRSLIDIAKEKNCENIFLEVAENNIPAISLYEKCGFNIVGRRKGFYNGVDALNLERIL